MTRDDSAADMAAAVAVSLSDLRYEVELEPTLRLTYAEGQLASRLGQGRDDAGTLAAVSAFLLTAEWRAEVESIAFHQRMTAPAATQFTATHSGAGIAGMWLKHRCEFHATHDGRRLIVGAAVDVSVEGPGHEFLDQSEILYRQVVENSADFAMRTTPSRTIQYVSASVTKVLGWTPSDLVGRNVVEFIHPADQRIASDQSAKLNRGETAVLRTRIRNSAGDYLWMAQNVRPILSGDGDVVARASVWRDITTEVEALEALAKSEERFRSAMRSAPTGVALIDAGRRFRAVNPALCRILAREESWLLTHAMGDVVHPADDSRELDLHTAVDSSQVDVLTADLRCIRSDGQTVWVRESVSPLIGSGADEASVAHFADITAARQAEERLHFLALHDELTGQLRPAALTPILGEMLAKHHANPARTLGVLFLDVDGMKGVNDTYGHEVGDKVIKMAAERIAASVRPHDSVARVGGDEFVVVVPDMASIDNVLAIAERLQNQFQLPMQVESTALHMTLSIGVAAAEPGDEPDQLLRRADLAMYASKHSGRGRATLG